MCSVKQPPNPYPPARGGFDEEDYYAERGIPWTHGTINMNAVNAAGDLSSRMQGAIMAAPTSTNI